MMHRTMNLKLFIHLRLIDPQKWDCYCCPETLADNYHSMPGNIPEDQSFYLHHGRSLSHVMQVMHPHCVGI